MAVAVAGHEHAGSLEVIPTRRINRQNETAGETSLMHVIQEDDVPTTAYPIVLAEHDAEILNPAAFDEVDSVEELVDIVLRQYENLQRVAQRIVVTAIGIGLMLVRLKNVQGRGAWLPFFRANLESRMSLSSAHLYMKVAREHGHRDPSEIEGLSLTELAGWTRPKTQALTASDSLAAITNVTTSAEEVCPEPDAARDEVPEPVPPQQCRDDSTVLPAAEVITKEKFEDEEEDESTAAGVPEEDDDYEADRNEVVAFETRVRALDIRSQLAHHEIFDRDVQAYDKVHTILIDALRQIDLTDNVTNLTGRHEVGLSFRRRLAFAAGVLPPEQWELCSRCLGQAKVHGGDCGTCNAQGYTVNHSESGRFELPPIATAQ